MTSTTLRDAHAVLFPAFDSLTLDDHLRRHLAGGGVSLLLGESREEYLARAMSSARRAGEGTDDFLSLAALAHQEAGDVLLAVDQELAGIQRLHGLVPALPSLDAARDMSDAALARACQATAAAARDLGVNLFLAPIADVRTGGLHPWLDGRTLGPNATEVARLASAYVRGVQRAGVAATAKHFPGYPALALDPAIAEARLAASRSDLAPGLDVFRAVVRAGVRAVMLGPAVVEALDPGRPASLSPAVVDLLRGELGFAGLAITDDLDARATLLDRTLADAAVLALLAGAELLMLAAGSHLPAVVRAIVRAVEAGELPAETLARAAAKVRAVAADPVPGLD
jgi:beta-N-acetylhexosaminidase